MTPSSLPDETGPDDAETLTDEERANAANKAVEAVTIALKQRD